MSEENKKEEKKKRVTMFDEMNAISSSIQAAYAVQESIMNSAIIQQMNQVSTLSAQMGEGLKSFNSLEEIGKMVNCIEIAFEWFQPILLPPNGLLDALEQIDTITKDFARMNEMFKLPNITIPEVSREITIIQRNNNTIIKVLAEEIERLERELAQQKTDNKELQALLEDKRKELKKQYVV